VSARYRRAVDPGVIQHEAFVVEPWAVHETPDLERLA
jgi:hypothetical protein